jgi:enamine deaminase RidA (YjgF/YER057c/UK114 family)
VNYPLNLFATGRQARWSSGFCDTPVLMKFVLASGAESVRPLGQAQWRNEYGFQKGTSMSEIQRIGDSTRWSDVVIHAGVARWVEVATDMTQNAQGQIRQVFSQIDATLDQIGSSRNHLLQILIYLTDLNDVPILNELWDVWVPRGHAPVRACVQAGLGKGCLVEMVISAAK